MNTNSRNSQEPEIQQLVPRGPGEVFKHTREQAGITLNEVCQFLHLPQDLIEALESDQQDRLPEPTYVKGYIRSYARYLELDPEPLVEGYMKYVYVPPAPPIRTQTPKKAPQRKAQRGPLDIALIAVLSCVFVFLSVWWFYPQPTKFISEISSMAAGFVGDADEPITNRSEEGAYAGNRMLENTPHIEQQSVASNSEVAQNTVAMNADETMAIEAAAQQPNTSVRGESQETDKSAETVKSEANEVAAQSPASLAEADGFETQGRVASGDDSLTLIFEDHSWTEVYDANKERLLFGLVNSGSVKELQGRAPFRILLGNSAAVSIKINGAAYDHSEFERFDKTARFLVHNSTGN